jgi:predicted nucleic acid-binding protein
VGLSAHYLADTSAVALVRQPAVRARLLPLIEAGLVARCSINDLEAGLSSRRDSDLHRTAARAGWPLVPINQSVMDRALIVQAELAGRGEQGSVKIGDLIVAAAAEQAHLVVLHYDQDFERISAVTGQPTEWVVADGTAD